MMLTLSLVYFPEDKVDLVQDIFIEVIFFCLGQRISFIAMVVLEICLDSFDGVHVL